ncbi:MAG: hypothetical protein SOU13_13195, partial [Eubacteriales bacterium]|nr:hypothetical protein [Eubacteriales bacterium]
MDFSSDANANFEGLLEVNREICMPQMAEKTSPDVPPNCAVVPQFLSFSSAARNAARSFSSAFFSMRDT